METSVQKEQTEREFLPMSLSCQITGRGDKLEMTPLWQIQPRPVQTHTHTHTEVCDSGDLT